MIRVILAEDHNIVRNGLKMLLESQSGVSVIAEANNGAEVLNLVEQGLEVDVVVADINMPELDGISLTESLKKTHPNIKVIILTMSDSDLHIAQAFNAGAYGYLLKNLGERELVFALDSVHSGTRYICTDLSLRMLDEKIIDFNSRKEKSDVQFSGRELEVLTLIADGFTNREMGEKLFLSKRTIEGHRQALLDKTNTKNTAMLIRFAYRNSFID